VNHVNGEFEGRETKLNEVSYDIKIQFNLSFSIYVFCSFYFCLVLLNLKNINNFILLLKIKENIFDESN
jgi:hypothetical protein